MSIEIDNHQQIVTLRAKDELVMKQADDIFGTKNMIAGLYIRISAQTSNI